MPTLVFFVFTFIRLLERSYFCLFLMKGLIKVLFLFVNETSKIENYQYRKQLSLRSVRGSAIVNTNFFFHYLESLTFDPERSYFSQVEVLQKPYKGLILNSLKSVGTLF